jgi:lysophospholipase L1-like esterase
MRRASRFAAVIAVALLAAACHLPAQTPGTIAVLGDSITWGWLMSGGQGDLPDGAFLYADPGATIWQRGFFGEEPPNAVLQDRALAAQADTVVLRYGTNDANPGTGPGGWEAADEAAWTESIGAEYVHPDACLVIVLPYVAEHVAFAAEVDQARAFLSGLAATRPNTFVIDWADHVGDTLSPDGVHQQTMDHPDLEWDVLTPEAYEAFTDSIDAALARCQ